VHAMTACAYSFEERVVVVGSFAEAVLRVSRNYVRLQTFCAYISSEQRRRRSRIQGDGFINEESKKRSRPG